MKSQYRQGVEQSGGFGTLVTLTVVMSCFSGLAFRTNFALKDAEMYAKFPLSASQPCIQC